jgi:pyruvate dehydrogenase E2 component (dihydrolipoamide acetyltransferase)
MAKFPAFRTQVHGEELLEFASSNIGIAVAVEDGLRVPVVMGVEGMNLAQLAEETKRVIQEARNGKSVNIGKGTFTISNLGMTEIEEFTAIINPPEAAILAVGRISDVARVCDGKIEPGRSLSMWLSSDHRVVDGIVASRFLTELKKLLEAPEVLERNEK